MLTLNNITEAGPPMATYKAGPRKRPPTHPGAIVGTALEDLRMSVAAAAKAIGVTRMALYNVINGDSAISAEMALRLGKFLGNGPELWINMQTDFDLWKARQAIGAAVEKIKPAAVPVMKLRQA